MAISEASIHASERFDRVAAEYVITDHQHAVAVLIHSYPAEFAEVCDVLLKFRISLDHIKKPGGNESDIPKLFSAPLRPLGWQEQKLIAKLVVDENTVSTDTHKVDYVKGRVALDLEWNSKDQTFDRDLYAFRAFHEYRKIGVGILVTRDDSLDDIFRSLGSYSDPMTGETKKFMAKYGASTTHMGKLLPRLGAGRSGGCPILAVGITPRQVTT